MIYKATSYQKQGIAFLCANECSAMFADPGLGKTGMTLAAFVALKKAGYVNRALIIAPIRVCHHVWPDEVKKFDQFKHLKTLVLHGPKKSRVSETDLQNADIVCINPEGLKWFFDNKVTLSCVKNYVFDTLIVDESSKFKRHSTYCFKLLSRHLTYFRRRHILTGTPSPKSLIDLWAQMYIVDRGKSLGRNITEFRNRFCYLDNPEYYIYKVRPETDPIIKHKIRDLAIRFDESLLDLPERIEYAYRVKLPADKYHQYKKMEKRMFAELDEGTIMVAFNDSIKRIICRQIANGCTYTYKEVEGDTERMERVEGSVVHVHDEKIKAVNEILDELNGKPCLIAYYFKHDYVALQKALKQRFGREARHIGSGVKTETVSENIRLWNQGKVPVLLVHPQSMSHGLNLQGGGNDLIWYSLTDSLEQYQQLNKRLHRMGTKGTVRIHKIVAVGTVDVAINANLENKAKGQRNLLDYLKLYREGKL